MRMKNFSWIFFTILIAASCTSEHASDNKKFRKVSSKESGITFQNRLQETVDFNIFNYLYFYNGGGVAAADLNGDGLTDLYFTGNQVDNKLYLNKGNFKFEDVTETAGVKGLEGWTTGVNVADINADGKLDIYVSQLGDFLSIKGKNQLYINEGNDENGVPKFSEKAAEFGLDFVGFGTQAAFFDYDLDGDLDMFMLNHSVHANGTFGKKDKFITDSHPLSGDKLLRNDDGKFVEVTKESGILNTVIGYGLGITTADINQDGFPDIYVGNDFHEDDYVYLNNGDGTFREVGREVLGHTSRFSMGNDVADFNNDGLPDIVSLDMLPADPVILKASAAEDTYDVFDFKLNFGYSYQLARNTLQLNMGNGKFSEIGLYSGVAATDWSWTPLFCDLDNDGYKDLFISNGIRRRSNDLDYINFISSREVQAKIQENITPEGLDLINKIPELKIDNFVFRNNGDLTFENKSEEWGLDGNSYSNGAIYADLDNDGDLDLVTNNVDQEVFIFENQTNKDTVIANNFLKIKLEGNTNNRFGIGTKVIIPTEKYGKIVQEMMPTRGYQSTVDYGLLVGLGDIKTVKTLTVVWPGGASQTLTNVPSNQTLTVKQAEASETYEYPKTSTAEAIFTEYVDTTSIDFKHKENKYVEFNREPLIPHMASTEGPNVAVGDLNGDGLEDFFIGGAKRQAANLYFQKANGTFRKVIPEVFQNDSLMEDVGVALFDVDNDKDLDLLVASGGNEFKEDDEPRLPRLYLNNGKGKFTKTENHLPAIYLTGSCVKPNDFDKDGDLDVFIGNRVEPWKYGFVPTSYLLVNDGNGKFSVADSSITNGIEQAGFVRNAVWADLDGNGFNDLITISEWMPVTFFLNENGKFTKQDPNTIGLSNSKGWWNAVTAEDFDNDGDIDLMMGNLGLNSKLKTSSEQPFTMYLKDFDDNKTKEPILVHYVNGKQQLLATKDELTKQLPHLNKIFRGYTDFAKAAVTDIFKPTELESAEKFTADTFTSTYIENLGNGQFKMTPLPGVAQFSPINTFYVEDLDGDGLKDVIIGANFYEVNIQLGRYDASHSTILKNRGNGKFEVMTYQESGLKTSGQVRDIQKIKLSSGEEVLIFARNNDRPTFFKFQKKNS